MIFKGSNLNSSEFSSAVLVPQLMRLQEILGARGVLWNRYYDNLGKLFESFGCRVLETPAYNETNFHMFAVVFPSQELRDSFINALISAASGVAFEINFSFKESIGEFVFIKL